MCRQHGSEYDITVFDLTKYAIPHRHTFGLHHGSLSALKQRRQLRW